MKNTKPYLHSSAWTDPVSIARLFSPRVALVLEWHAMITAYSSSLQAAAKAFLSYWPTRITPEWKKAREIFWIACSLPTVNTVNLPGCGLGRRTRELPVPSFVPVPSFNNAMRLSMFFAVTSTGRWWYSCHTQSFLPRERKVAGRKRGKCTEVDMKFSLLCYSCQ